MTLYYAVLIILKVCNVQADDHHHTVTDSFYLNTGEPALKVLEGTKVTLTCPKFSGSVLYINFVYSHIFGEGYNTLIDTSNMTDISSKYSFNGTNENTYAFTINGISRDDEGSYTCVQGRDSRFRAITVIYSPPGCSPQCSSNYKSPIIFYDEIRGDFVFNCSTERGKPPVTTKIYVNDQEVTSDLETASETRTDIENVFTTYSLLRPFNNTLQNSEFVCNVTQQLPSPYDDYQGFCSFGPLHLLPGFSLSVSPSNVTVREERNVTLTCTSNVTGINITWNNIPSVKYTVTNNSRSSVLTILSFKPALNGIIFVQCSGSYGSRTVTANTTFLLMFRPNAEEPESENSKGHVDGILIIIFFLGLGLGLCTFVAWRIRKKRKLARTIESIGNVSENTGTLNHRQNHTLASTEEFNMNNGNNTAIYQKDDIMCDNIIYESASSGNMNEFSEEGKVKSCENRNPCFEIGNYVLGDEHIICENVIYQSVSNANKEGRITADHAF